MKYEVSKNSPESKRPDGNFRYEVKTPAKLTLFPSLGEYVHIQQGQTILLDTDTPVLSVLLIQGGHVMFDRKDVHLQAEYILILDGGKLTIGKGSSHFF